MPLAIVEKCFQFLEVAKCIKLGQVSSKLMQSPCLQIQFKKLLFASQIRSTHERRLYWAHKTYTLGQQRISPTQYEQLIKHTL